MEFKAGDIIQRIAQPWREYPAGERTSLVLSQNLYPDNQGYNIMTLKDNTGCFKSGQLRFVSKWWVDGAAFEKL
mgnify:CR=1 FL=1